MEFLREAKVVFQLLAEKQKLNRKQKEDLTHIISLLGLFLGLSGAGISEYFGLIVIGSLIFIFGCVLLMIGMLMTLSLVIWNKKD